METLKKKLNELKIARLENIRIQSQQNIFIGIKKANKLRIKRKIRGRKKFQAELKIARHNHALLLSSCRGRDSNEE